MDVSSGNADSLCCQRRAGGKNTFCIAVDCDVDHRNAQPKVQLDLDTIIILRSKNAAFVSPMGSVKFISAEVLKEWKKTAAFRW